MRKPFMSWGRRPSPVLWLKHGPAGPPFELLARLADDCDLWSCYEGKKNLLNLKVDFKQNVIQHHGIEDGTTPVNCNWQDFYCMTATRTPHADFIVYFINN